MDRPSRDRNRRRSRRVQHGDLVGYAEQRRDGLFHLLGTARALDVSETGLRAVLHEPLPLGRVLAFSLKIDRDLHHFRGRIVWCAELEEGKTYEAGVRFHEVDFELTRRLFELAAEDSARQRAIELQPETADEPAPVIESVEPARFSPLSNKPLDPRGDDRELARHVAGSAAPPAPGPGLLGELLGNALSSAPAGGLQSPAELRDALTRVAGALAEAEGKAPARRRPPSERSLPPRSRRTPPPSGLKGTFEGDDLIDLVGTLAESKLTGMLEVLGSDRSGHMAFRGGRIVAARSSDERRGAPAVLSLLELHVGSFRFRPDLLSSLVVEHELRVEAVLLEVARRRDGGTGLASSQEDDP